MIEKKYRKIIAKIMIIVMITALTGAFEKAVCAAESSDEGTVPLTEYNTAPNIVKDHYFGDIKFWNIVLYKENGLSTLCCEVTNTGSELFQGNFDIVVFDEKGNKMATLLGYIGEELFPDETRTLTSCTDMDLMSASRFEVSMSGGGERIEKESIIQRRMIENLLTMDNIKLFSNKKKFWAFEFTLDIEDYIDYVMPESFELYITFKDNAGERLFDKTMQIQVKDWKIGFQTFYTTEDLSDASYLEVRTNLPPYTPPAVNPTPTPTPKPTPGRTAEPTVEPTPEPTKLYEEFHNPGIVKDYFLGDLRFTNIRFYWEDGLSYITGDVINMGNEVFEGNFSLIFLDSAGHKMISMAANIGEELEPEQIKPFTSCTDMNLKSAVSLKIVVAGSDFPVETLPSYVPTSVPEQTSVPSAVPTRNPDVIPLSTPSISPKPTATVIPTTVPKVKKLIKPKISITVKKYKKKMWIAKIRLKKYQGTYIEIYYRRGKGKFRKVKLKQSNIKKNKKLFKVGYKGNGKPIYIRVRTYRKQGEKKIYSKYSSVYRLKKQKIRVRRPL